MELQYKIESFNIQDFSGMIGGRRNQHLNEDMHYFSYNDVSTWSASDLYKNSCRFIVAYNKKLILGIAKVAIYDTSKDHISISYLSVHKDFLNHGIGKRMIEETVKVCKEFNIPLGTSEYSVEGWKYLRKYLLEYTEKYGVEFMDNVVGYPGRLGNNDEFYALIDESKKIIMEKYPEKSHRYIW